MLTALYQPQTRLEEQVYSLMQFHGIQKPDQIDLNSMCESYRVEIININGRSRIQPHPTRPGWYLMAIDKTLHPNVQRLKIAHEFGHLLLHVGIQPNCSDLMIEWQESQANHFAEHLLMPFYMFEGFAFQITLYEAPMYLSQLFRVPERTAKQRFDRFLSRMYNQGLAHYI
ncbi:hypothetical protein BRE01_49300 [Brevibacillus reuszeri]|uniref:Peptidase n=1 Tax=Brevibacillus reuszeri TaxID=54915 RepID=A0A0K9YLJ4_9BACL|nr:ImmA/IrrE family metallo-endopeptidase [Brevibacillus reuszeri]KNB69527.1 peptidase [Brevibacillus reuszeri]MED1856107.1 ImmA/IrrE family metallo-endopeptidase [Brevibacillus reuszeri]GED71228.1 hypothetical protein BRE01_49300 [Brevibacillus reuszeri]